jgi:RNA polymerase sigma-70 factor (ECF subfamily)
LNERTFEDLDAGPDVGSEAAWPTPVLEPEQSAHSSPMATIGRQIEAEIPFLQRMVRRWHREAADADDLVQDTLLRALANAHLWQPGSNLRAWLVTIMRNQFLGTIARSQRRGEAAEILDITDHCTSAAVEARLTLRDVERAFRRLSAKQRSAVLLAGIEGRPYVEVARAMGLSVDAVRCHLARAREQLRKAVYRCDEKTWMRSALARPRAVPTAALARPRAVPVVALARPRAVPVVALARPRGVPVVALARPRAVPVVALARAVPVVALERSYAARVRELV